MRPVGNKRHFFGDHPASLCNGTNFAQHIASFERAAKMLPGDIRIINCTVGSALTCFEKGKL